MHHHRFVSLVGVVGKYFSRSVQQSLSNCVLLSKQMVCACDMTSASRKLNDQNTVVFVHVVSPKFFYSTLDIRAAIQLLLMTWIFLHNNLKFNSYFTLKSTNQDCRRNRGLFVCVSSSNFHRIKRLLIVYLTAQVLKHFG